MQLDVRPGVSFWHLLLPSLLQFLTLAPPPLQLRIDLCELPDRHYSGACAGLLPSHLWAPQIPPPTHKCTRIHTHTCTHAHTHTHTHTHTRIHTHSHAHMRTHQHMHTCVMRTQYLPTHNTHLHTQAHMSTHLRRCTYAAHTYSASLFPCTVTHAPAVQHPRDQCPYAPQHSTPMTRVSMPFFSCHFFSLCSVWALAAGAAC